MCSSDLATLNAYAASLAETYGQKEVPFIYAQPTEALAPGIAKPQIKNGKSIDFGEWPKSLKVIATRLGALAAQHAHGRK